MKVLHLDIETAPKMAYVWGLYNQNIAANQLISDYYIICWCAKWHGSKKVLSDSIHFYEDYDKDPESDKHILKTIWALMDEADIIVGHNGDRFDLPSINTRFLIHDMKPPSSYRTIDTLKIARNKFKFTSNRLDALGQSLGVGRKIDTGGMQLWVDCLKGDLKALDKMVKYCKQDVRLLEEVYNKLKPYHTKHPVIDMEERACTSCGSKNVHKKGCSYTNTMIYQRYKCMDCGHNMRGEKVGKSGNDLKNV